MIYAPELKEKVREMGGKGMNSAAIFKALPNPKPSMSTITRWLDPDEYERHLKRTREIKRAGRTKEQRDKDNYRSWVSRGGGRYVPPKKLHACECPQPLWTKDVHDDTETCLYCGRGRTAPEVPAEGAA